MVVSTEKHGCYHANSKAKLVFLYGFSYSNIYAQICYFQSLLLGEIHQGNFFVNTMKKFCQCHNINFAILTKM